MPEENTGLYRYLTERMQKLENEESKQYGLLLSMTRMLTLTDDEKSRNAIAHAVNDYLAPKKADGMLDYDLFLKRCKKRANEFTNIAIGAGGGLGDQYKKSYETYDKRSRYNWRVAEAILGMDRFAEENKNALNKYIETQNDVLSDKPFLGFYKEVYENQKESEAQRTAQNPTYQRAYDSWKNQRGNDADDEIDGGSMSSYMDMIFDFEKNPPKIGDSAGQYSKADFYDVAQAMQDFKHAVYGTNLANLDYRDERRSREEKIYLESVEKGLERARQDGKVLEQILNQLAEDAMKEQKADSFADALKLYGSQSPMYRILKESEELYDEKTKKFSFEHYLRSGENLNDIGDKVDDIGAEIANYLKKENRFFNRKRYDTVDKAQDAILGIGMAFDDLRNVTVKGSHLDMTPDDFAVDISGRPIIDLEWFSVDKNGNPMIQTSLNQKEKDEILLKEWEEYKTQREKTQKAEEKKKAAEGKKNMPEEKAEEEKAEPEKAEEEKIAEEMPEKENKPEENKASFNEVDGWTILNESPKTIRLAEKAYYGGVFSEEQKEQFLELASFKKTFGTGGEDDKKFEKTDIDRYIRCLKEFGPTGKVTEALKKFGNIDKSKDVNLKEIASRVYELQNDMKHSLDQATDEDVLPRFKYGQLQELQKSCKDYFEEHGYKNTEKNQAMRTIAELADTAAIFDMTDKLRENVEGRLKDVMTAGVKRAWEGLDNVKTRFMRENSGPFKKFCIALGDAYDTCLDVDDTMTPEGAMKLQEAAWNYIDAKKDETKKTDKGQLRLDIAKDVFDLCEAITGKSFEMFKEEAEKKQSSVTKVKFNDLEKEKTENQKTRRKSMPDQPRKEKDQKEAEKNNANPKAGRNSMPGLGNKR